MDYNDIYNYEYANQIDILNKKITKEVITKKGPKNEIRNEFIRYLNWASNTILEGRDTDDINASSYNIHKNNFLKDLLNCFNSIGINFPDEGINGFVEYQLSTLREKHFERFTNGDKKYYEFQAEEIFKKSDKQLIELLAKYFAYKDFDHPSLSSPKRINQKRNNSTTSLEKNPKVEDFIKIKKPTLPKLTRAHSHLKFTREQTNILFKLMLDENMILNDKNYQTLDSICLAIYSMTGYSSNTIHQNFRHPIDSRKVEDLVRVRNGLKSLINKINIEIDEK